jgi:signal transduction histidine kinase
MIPMETDDPSLEVTAGDPLIITVEESQLLMEYGDHRRAVIDATNDFVQAVADPAQLGDATAQAKFAAIRAAWGSYAAFLAANKAQISNAEFKLDSSNMEMIHELLLMAYDGGNMTTELTRELQLRQNELYQREPPKHKEIDFFAMVKRSFDECAVEAATKNQEFDFEGADEGIYVFGVENELKRPFVQIIENAIKYTPEGGAVKVSVCSEDRQDASHGHVRFSVKDNGIGIPPGEENLVFGLCERCSNAKDFNKNGTGTGLYNDRKVILHHNGDVRVESEGVGKGSTFHIKLPIYRRIAAVDPVAVG